MTTDERPASTPSKWDQIRDNRANQITLAHLIGSLGLIGTYAANPKASIAYVITHGALAGLDYLDGKIARRNGPTEFGKQLDPLADATHVVGLMTVMAATGAIHPAIPAVVGARELGVKLYRNREQRKGNSMPARCLGKAKMWAQTLFIAAPLTPTVGDYTTAVAAAGVGVTALTLASGADAIIAHKRRKQRSITPES